MALRRSARSCSGDQLRRHPASNRPAPQLPGRNKKKNLSLLTASAIEVARSIDDTAATNGTDGNKGNISIKGTQGKVGGDNKSDIGQSDREVGDDNDGNGVIDGNEVNPGGDNEVGDYNDGNGSNKQVGDYTDGDGGTNHNKVNKGGNDGAPSNESNSEDVSSASSGNEGFVVAANNEPGPCAWMSAHQCICTMEAPVLCKGNSTEMCLCIVHQECLLFWERTQPASMIRGATPKGTNRLVCLMHHSQYQVKDERHSRRRSTTCPQQKTRKTNLLTVRITASIAVKAMTAISL
jgi:hypothetical protein